MISMILSCPFPYDIISKIVLKLPLNPSKMTMKLNSSLLPNIMVWPRPVFFSAPYFVFSCMTHFDAIKGVVVYTDGRGFIQITSSCKTNLPLLLKGDSAIEPKKLSVGFKRVPPAERKKFLHEHLILVEPIPSFGFPTLVELFKESFCMVLAMASIILEHNDDWYGDEAMLALLMIIFPMDEKISMIF